MAQLPNWRDMDLNDDDLFNPDKSMHYWSKIEPRDFMVILVHDIKHELSVVEFLAKMITDDPEASSVSIAKLGGQTIGEICKRILERKVRINDILDIGSEYAKRKFPDS